MLKDFLVTIRQVTKIIGVQVIKECVQYSHDHMKKWLLHCQQPFCISVFYDALPQKYCILIYHLLSLQSSQSMLGLSCNVVRFMNKTQLLFYNYFIGIT